MAEMRNTQINSSIMNTVSVLNHHTNHNNHNSGHRRSRQRAAMQALISEALPLDEAARLEMQSLPSKTPVSVLQELLSRRGTTPKYELVQIEGAVHEPTFRYRVTVADVVAIGTGRSKKDAKHAAAKAVLDKIIGVNSDSIVEMSMSNNNINNSNSNNSSMESQNQSDSSGNCGDEKIINNPIGSLQEMCMSRHWPPPKYTMEGESGLPHERQFKIVCMMLKYKQVGMGKSKKLAKRQAAHKMWQALRDLPESTTGLDDDENTCLNDTLVNLVQFLRNIATEQNFEVTFVDIEEKSMTGQCQCLVQLSTLPVAVCFGTGSTNEEAQSRAAKNALEYLKIMTKQSK
ncbi:RISC-loading complex subunit tarbp2-like isoform X2 [Aphidius gifuensis]|uniref:RISC-loading complex subunit tarbp2-like isoform X2 n=1 Tax=Aphidius gifuensis TaxID=684658 RepID=UPI001CDBF09E|nr:RISC-loading complex subunit tarbp2-like isoform X2 [Aphidius gifuensis]XP_044008080.1 RISC-loading complex subunit tarbp2-like isoform X2 [Aphidius gifuensis]